MVFLIYEIMNAASAIKSIVVFLNIGEKIDFMIHMFIRNFAAFAIMVSFQKLTAVIDRC